MPSTLNIKRIPRATGGASFSLPKASAAKSAAQVKLSCLVCCANNDGSTDGVVRMHPWAKFGTGNRNTLSAYGRSAAEAQALALDRNIKDNGVPNGNAATPLNDGVGVVDPANPLPALPSESDPDGGPVGRETRRRLMEWWQTEYCAGRMRLAVVGRGKGKGELFNPHNNSDTYQNHLMN